MEEPGNGVGQETKCDSGHLLTPRVGFGKRGREELLGTTAFGTASLCLARASMHQMEHDAELAARTPQAKKQLEEDWKRTLPGATHWAASGTLMPSATE